MTWDDEVMLLKRELARAHASLKLEEQRNRALPQLTAASSPEEWDRRANAAVTKYLAWLKSRDILRVDDYLDPALRERIGPYSPLETRNFFSIASHYEPITLFAHFQHWFDHAWLKHAPNPSPIRRAAWLNNVWDSRAEGAATAMEEINNVRREMSIAQESGEAGEAASSGRAGRTEAPTIARCF